MSCQSARNNNAPHGDVGCIVSLQRLSLQFLRCDNSRCRLARLHQEAPGGLLPVGRDSRYGVTEHERVDVVRSLVRVHTLEIRHVAHGGVLGQDSVSAE